MINYHDIAIIQTVSELMNRGFKCYLEYGISRDERHSLFVDVYATKGNSKVIVEVGFLSQRKVGERLTLLRKLMPSAQIFHYPTLQNWRQIWQAIEDEEKRWKRYLAKASSFDDVNIIG